MWLQQVRVARRSLEARTNRRSMYVNKRLGTKLCRRSCLPIATRQIRSGHVLAVAVVSLLIDGPHDSCWAAVLPLGISASDRAAQSGGLVDMLRSASEICAQTVHMHVSRLEGTGSGLHQSPNVAGRRDSGEKSGGATLGNRSVRPGRCRSSHAGLATIPDRIEARDEITIGTGRGDYCVVYSQDQHGARCVGPMKQPADGVPTG